MLKRTYTVDLKGPNDKKEIKRSKELKKNKSLSPLYRQYYNIARQAPMAKNNDANHGEFGLVSPDIMMIQSHRRMSNALREM